MFGRYVTINCLYVKEPMQVWVLCNPNESVDSLKDRAKRIVLNEMEKQLKENEND